MAVSSQVSEYKRGRDEYWNGGLALPVAKRTDTGRLVNDYDVMALLEEIDNMDGIDSNPDVLHNVNQLEDERLSGVTESLEDEFGLKGQQDKVDSVDIDGKGSTETGSIKQGERIEGKTETTSASYTRQMQSEEKWPCYDDVCAELDFFVDDITLEELGINMQNPIDGASMPDIMYSDPVQGYADTREVFYGSLWEDDIWQLKEDPVIQNDFASPQQEEFGINGAEFHDVRN